MNRTGIGARLTRLEARVPAGCATCPRWDGLVLADDAGNRSRPERCPDCGRVVPVRSLLILVGVPLAAI